MNTELARRESFSPEDRALHSTLHKSASGKLAPSRTLLARDPDAADRPAKYRLAGALVLALALHLVALYYLTASPVSIELTSDQGASAKSISVSLISAPPAPPVVAVAQPVTPHVSQPVHRPVPKPVKSTPVLATHHTSPRTVEQQEEVQPPQPQSQVQPPVQQAQAAAPAAAPAAPSAQAAAGDDSKMLALPKAIDSSALRQLGCRIPAPAYPPRAKRLGEAGTVRVQVRIGTDGLFSDVRVLSSSNFPDLDSAAIQAISGGICQPYRQNGTAVAVTAVQPISFNLGD
ncbi:energy transducer TonB [Caballeronia sp. dw_19]|uniref:energy transducer TonB n=1 Tax=Caballeronia sp. dw_19 TaxID=2719791 RepID=UPI001BD5BF31|nr:energy transducer TonB [Caballeronia sp. dw_19]